MSLDILWVSNSPLQPTGYGTVTENLLPRLQENTEHNFSIYAMSGLSNSVPLTWSNDIDLFGQSKASGENGWNDIQRLYHEEDFDLVMFGMDAWIYADKIQGGTDFPYISYAPIDHTPLPRKWRIVAKNSLKMIPYTYFGKEKLEEAGFENKTTEPIYHGVDLSVFQEIDKYNSTDLGFQEDTFVVTINKANQGGRTKYPRMLKAFRKFLEDNEEAQEKARLYIHALPSVSNGYNLRELAEEYGISQYVRMPEDAKYLHAKYDDHDVAEIYNASDVLLNSIAGEGFGLPILESMACGTPVIGTNFSAMPELIKGIKENEPRNPEHLAGGHFDRGWMAHVESWETSHKKSADRALPEVKDIVHHLEHAFKLWTGEYGQDENAMTLEEMSHNCKEFASQHTWEDKAQKFGEVIDSISEKEEEVTGYGPLSLANRQVDPVELDTIFQHVKEYSGGKVLDVGCGAGELMSFLDSKGFEVSGCDVSPVCVEQSKQNGHDNVWECDMRELKTFYAEDQFDVVTAQHVIEHIPREDRVEALHDMIDIAEEKVVIVTPSPRHKQFDPEYPEEEMIPKSEVEEWMEEVNDREEDLVFNKFPEGQEGAKIDWFIEIIHKGGE